MRVPDLEFFVNLGDWPLEKRRPSERLHPIFSWCGSNDTRDIVMPTYDLTESVLETMGRQAPLLLSSFISVCHPLYTGASDATAKIFCFSECTIMIVYLIRREMCAGQII